ncbi:MAG: putative toxin-antitoxin system toxin component, PIN family [Desulfobacteraceae bacterium]|nr:putative toxin-antitoxin system toxin component, PIN family [Desulfobacteraceae bacterium]
MKVVIDTNVFVSSFFGGHPGKIFQLWKSGLIVWCLSGDILDEYINVLNRLGLKDEKEIEELLRLFKQGVHVLFTRKPRKLQVVEKDPDDDKFFECALALGAHAIISGDKAVLAVKHYRGIHVYAPGEFVALFEG